MMIGPTEIPEPSGPSYKVTMLNSIDYIKGNVYEDLGDTYNTYNNSGGGIDSSKGSKNIKSVKVTCTNLNTGEIRETTTGEDGNWRFDVEEFNNYKIDYYYGQNVVDLSNIEETKNVLKYNAIDYLVSEISSSIIHKTIDYDAEKYEVEQSGGGVTQVMIMLDCSGTMRSDKMKSDGEEKTILEVAVDATRTLIDKLLASKSNIYIGLVFFSGENYRAKSLTKNKDELNLALDDILTNGWCIYNTNIESAINKAMDSFYSDKNRHIVMVTDGFPTAANGLEIEAEDSGENIVNKLNQIADITQNRVKQILEEGVSFTSLITSPNETEGDRSIRNVIDNIFGNGLSDYDNNNYKIVGDSSIELEDVIEYDITENIEEIANLTEKEETEYIPAIGCEDYDRYLEAIENFQEWDLKNVNLFKLIETYGGEDGIASEEEKQQVADFLNKIWGHAEGGTYSIPEQYDESDEKTIYDTDDEGNILYDKILEVIKVSHTGYDEHMCLARRPAFTLGLDIEATGMELTLSNGTKYIEKKRDYGSNDILLTTLDEDMAYGSELNVIYTGRIKNESKMPYKQIQIICYLPNYVTGVQSDKRAQIVSIEQLHNMGYIGDEQYRAYKDTKKAAVVTINFDENNKEELAKTINNYDYRIKFSIRIPSLEYIEDITCISEILSYSNYMNFGTIKTTRRMTERINTGSGAEEKSISPASDIKETAEIDWAESPYLPIIPPTGLNNKMEAKNNIINAGLIILTTLVAITYIVRKNKKSK